MPIPVQPRSGRLLRSAHPESQPICPSSNPRSAVDTHGARDQWMCVFVYQADQETEPAQDRRPMKFVEAYIGYVVESDFRLNSRRGALGTRTATLDRKGILELRSNWVYKA